MTHTIRRLAAGAACALLLAACSSDADQAIETGSDGGDPAVEPSLDPSTEPPVDVDAIEDEFPVEEAREAARALIGTSEADLPDDVRVGRRGDQHFALTEDYRLGRITVELDDVDGSGFEVVSATVELPDAPETFGPDDVG